MSESVPPRSVLRPYPKMASKGKGDTPAAGNCSATNSDANR